MVENFSHGSWLGSGTATESISGNRIAPGDGISAHKPVDDIDVVNVLLSDVVSAKPVEVIPVAHLVFHFGPAGLARNDPGAACIPPGVTGNDLTDETFFVNFLESSEV